jgi:hypothetical protein
MPTNPGDPRDNGKPRPPDGDWLGGPYLSGDVAVASERATFRVPEPYRGIAEAHPALRVDGRL